MSSLEIAGFVLSVLGVWLTARQHILCWPVGIGSVIVYAIVFIDVKLYSDAGLQVAFALMLVYGWYAWLKTGPAPDVQRPVGRATPVALFLPILLGAVATAGLGHAMSTYTDASLPYWDAGTTSFSLVAQWLTARKAIECWPLWIAVDLVYIGMYIAKDLQLTAVLYAIFIGLALYGWQQWHSALQSPRAG